MTGLKRSYRMLVGLALVWIPFPTQAQSNTTNAGEVVCYLPLPAGIKPAELKPGSTLATSLHRYARRKLELANSALPADADRVILFTDASGKVVRPQLISSSANRVSSYNLQFTFNSPGQPWTAVQIGSFNTWIGDIYPAIRQLLGSPFFNNTVNIRRDSTISVSGYYYPALNEIVLRSATAQTFCHEVIHAFRDDYLMALSVFEEGLTRAAEVEVFGRLAAYTHPSDEFHGYEYDQYYSALNRPAIGCYNGNLATNITLTAMKYNLASYTWGKMQIEDTAFLRRFNDSLYDRAVADLSILSTSVPLRELAARIKPVAEGLPFATWAGNQYILQTNPAGGYQLFQRINQYYVDYFFRDIYGGETPQSGNAVTWTVLDHTGNMLGSGTGTTTAVFGWVDCGVSLPGYSGRIKLIATVQSPQGLLTDTAIRAYLPGASGVFGIVEDADSGTVLVTPLDTAMATQAAALTNGAFQLPSLKLVRGRFRVDYYYPGCGHVSRIFTKDRSSYFISLNRDTKAYWVGAVDTEWSNPFNWSGGAVPDECTDVIILAGGPHNCVINSPAMCRSITINSGAVVTANNDLTVTGNQ